MSWAKFRISIFLTEHQSWRGPKAGQINKESTDIPSAKIDKCSWEGPRWLAIVNGIGKFILEVIGESERIAFGRNEGTWKLSYCGIGCLDLYRVSSAIIPN